MRLSQQLRSEIELEAHALDIGESVGDLECPFCHGGQSGERKFSISRTDAGLVYNCYRAGCPDGRGFIATRGSLLPGTPRTDSKLAKWKGPYTGTFEPLKKQDVEYVKHRFDLDIPRNGFLGINSRNQYVAEIKTMDGYVRGYTVRRGCWSGNPPCFRDVAKTGPKTKVYYHNPYDTGPSWHPAGCQNAGCYSVVVVEDQMSAAKVAQAGYVGVALLGAYFGEDTVKEISKYAPEEVVIALDPDASSAAFTAARKWGLAFPKTKVLVLKQDIKDMKRNEVQEILK